MKDIDFSSETRYSEKEPQNGDVVYLRSGGPAMTVAIRQNAGLSGTGLNYVHCTWFDLELHVHDAQFATVLLVQYEVR